jgi:Lar family restriction alleviation protein
MKPNLLPCPFCGGKARLDQRETQSLWNSSDATFSHVSCDECDIHGQDFCDDPSGEEAIEWWNTRIQSAPAEVAQGEAIHQWEFAEDAWMDADEAGAASARCEGYKTRIVYTSPPSPDAELRVFQDAMMYGSGMVKVNTDGSREHIDIGSIYLTEAERNNAELVALLRDAAEVIRDSDSGWYLLKRIDAKLACLVPKESP